MIIYTLNRRFIGGENVTYGGVLRMRLLGDKGLLRGLLAATNLVGVRDRNNERDDSDETRSNAF